MVISEGERRPLRVAIIGAGPAGLALAIALSRLPFASYQIYEKGDTVKEIGAGISIQGNTWRVLQKLGAAKNIHPGDVFRTPDRTYLYHRNGRTGEVVSTKGQKGVRDDLLHARAHRAVLQNALLKEVDPGHIRTASKLIDLHRNADGTTSLFFEDGLQVDADLVVGADGIRSVVRSKIFPEHRIAYTGRTSYRTLISTSDVERIPELLDQITFWHGQDGNWVYTCPLGNNVYEITTMAAESSKGKEHVSWGQEARLDQMRQHYTDFDPIIQRLLQLPTSVQQYALFAGPHLSTVVATDSKNKSSNIALIGDASHPLSGAFGAGAGFALEDAWTLAESLRWAYRQDNYSAEHYFLETALHLFDGIRSPRYAALYGVLAEYAFVNKRADAAAADDEWGFDEKVAFRVKGIWNGDRHPWITDFDVESHFRDAVDAIEKEAPLQTPAIHL